MDNFQQRVFAFLKALTAKQIVLLAGSALIVGGTIWSRMARMEKMASTAPAAPRRCPIDDFVEDIEILPAALPNSLSTACSSISSPSGVEVPCAFT